MIKKIKWNPEIWICLLGCILTGAYLGVSWTSAGLGFPLDDAWIHQAYARNLAQYGGWFYFPGNMGNGSTAPLWTFLLAIGYRLNLPNLMWTYLLGVLFLVGTALLGYRILKRYHPDQPHLALWGALFLCGEWHLVWASVSGMETPLITCLITAVFLGVIQEKINGWLVGFLAGLAVWVRPDALTLLGPILFIIVFNTTPKNDKLLVAGKMVFSFLMVFIPFLLFNQITSGHWMPNTFYAKQAEYAILQNEPLFLRFGKLMAQPWIGAGVLLLPGFIYTAYQSIRKKKIEIIAWVLFWLGYVLIYAVSLPVTYQHGRYQMPSMPVYFILGLIGSFDLMILIKRSRPGLLIKKSWILSLIIVWLAFNILGVEAYSQDTAIIQNEMVKTAQWISQNTPSNSIIAAHDIGALGYWGDRKIIDLAGLVSSDVVPIIRDETQLREYLNNVHADYLMTFPTWYPILVKDKTLVYQSDDYHVIEAGGENMTVYLWK